MTLFPEFPQHEPLTGTERLLWEVAKGWRQPEALTVPSDLDWDRWLEIGGANKMSSLLFTVLQNSPRLGRSAPEHILIALSADREKQEATAEIMSRSLVEYLRRTDARGLETVVLKGLWVSKRVYGDPAIRPGGDIDVLHRRQDISASLEVLEEMELGRHWPNLLDDAYYDRHHLHQQRCTRDLKIWFEPHWAFDHPYTLFTVDYDGLMDRTRSARLLEAPVRDMDAPDLILSLSLHLVKHAVYLPQMLDRPDLPRLILADGMLMYYLDVAEVVKQLEGRLDWEHLVELAQEWGAGEVLGSVLSVCRRLFGAPVPEQVLEELPATPKGPLVRAVLERMVEYELATYLGEPPSSFWRFLTLPNGAFILRPIRALDALAYIFPPREYLKRQYGNGRMTTRVGHLARALGQFIRLGVDTATFAWERYRRLKAMNQSASLFNRLEPE